MLAAQRWLVRVELLRSRLDRAEVDHRRHFGLVAVVADDRRQNALHALGQHAFHAAGVVELLAGHGQLGVFALIGQQVALLVDHGHARLAQLGHAGGD